MYVTFPNGDFFQAGYVDLGASTDGDCSTGFASFVTALNSNNVNLFPNLYNIQNCGLTGDHYFKLANSAGTGTTRTWQWYMSDHPIGPALTLPVSQDHFVANQGGQVTEIVDTSPINNSEPLPTTEYSPAIQYETASSPTIFIDAQTGIFLATSDRICRYAMAVPADNLVYTGLESVINPAHCHSPGDTLWSP
jgi:hypothetical protein